MLGEGPSLKPPCISEGHSSRKLVLQDEFDNVNRVTALHRLARLVAASNFSRAAFPAHFCTVLCHEGQLVGYGWVDAKDGKGEASGAAGGLRHRCGMVWFPGGG